MIVVSRELFHDVCVYVRGGMDDGLECSDGMKNSNAALLCNNKHNRQYCRNDTRAVNPAY